MRLLFGVVSVLISAALANAEPAWGSTDAELARAAIRTKQFARAVEVLRPAAARGDAESQYLLGLAYASGVGVELSAETAREWLLRAAEQSHADAAFALAGLLAEGDADHRKHAELWLRRASELGHPLARELNETKQLPLHSLRHGDVRAAGTRIEVSVTDSFGRSVLAHAAFLGSVENVTLLLSAGARADIADRFGTTPLMLAAQREDVRLLDVLLPVSSIDALDQGGNTALMYAARAGRNEQVSRLIRASAKLNLTNADGWSALDLARRAQQDVVAGTLSASGATGRVRQDAEAPGIDPSRGGEMYRNWPELAVAASRDDAALVVALLSAGAVADARTPSGDTALLVAAKAGSARVVEPLIRGGAERSRQDAAGASSLVIAAGRGDLPLIEALVRNGLAPNPSEAAAALLAATSAHHTGAVRRLIAAGADVDSHDGAGITAVMIAARANDRSLTEALLAARPSLEKADRGGRTALWHAAAGGAAEAVRLLLEAGASVRDSRATHSPLMAAVRANSLESVNLLLRHGASTNPASVTVTTPLIAAAQFGSAEIIAALLAAGADVDRRDEAADTALIVAARGGNESACRTLLRAGADVRLRNLDRLNALDVARRRGFVSIVTLLD